MDANGRKLPDRNGPGDPPVEKGVEGDVLKNNYDQPEDDLERGLGVFVAEEALGEEGTGPAAEEGAEVEDFFGYAAGAAGGAAFIRSVEGEGDEGREDEPAEHPRTAGGRGVYPDGRYGGE